MGLFTRDRPAPARVEPRMERRDVAVAAEPGWFGLDAISGQGGGYTNPRLAENLATVVACVNAVSAGIASLPARVYRTEGNGRVEAPGHPVSRLIRSPNRAMTWPDFAEFLVAQMLLRGNALAAIERDGAGRPITLTPIPWDAVAVECLPSGRLVYIENGRRHLDTEVLHLRDRMDGPHIGRSRISRAPAAVDSALGLQTYSSSVWNNAATPSLAIGLPPNMTAAGRERMDAFYSERHAGAHNARKILYTDSSVTVTPLSISPEDAEVLASRQFSVIELCRLFNVPPPIVQSYEFNTFTNASQANLWFASNTLAPIARKLEAEFSRSVFSDPALHIEIDLSGLLRGDYATRWTANVAAVGANILTVDEVREQEGYGPLSSDESNPPLR